MTVEPRNMAELRAVKGEEAQVRAATAYLARVAEFEMQAREFRADAVRRLAEKHGPSKAARLSGLSLSTVKIMVRGAR